MTIHKMGGGVLRGRLIEADLEAEALEVHPPLGDGRPEIVATSRIAAIFFNSAPGDPPATMSGQPVVVRFETGRQMKGKADMLYEGSPGFFFLPDDAARTMTAKIFVYRHGSRVVETS